MTPHEKQDYEIEYEKEIAEIKALTDADLAKMRIWQVMEKAVPYGLAPEVAETLERDVRTVEAWRTNPDLLPNQTNDPSGRRGYGHHYNLLLLAINGPFPPGAKLLLRWQALKLAKGQAIQDHDRMEAIVQLAEEMRGWGEELDALQSKRRALEEKMAAIVTGWVDTT